MSTETLDIALLGALTLASWVAGLFFLRFWRSSGDRLFLFFAIAFWLLTLSWAGRALIHWEDESRHQVFLLRLLAFVVVIVAVIDKNRRANKE
jgi:hypothetical protein